MNLKPEDAWGKLCPFAKTFIRSEADKTAHCVASDCILWRWHELPSSLLEPHVKARIKETGGGQNSHKDAVAWVMERRSELGIPTKPTHGYCGVGGRP